MKLSQFKKKHFNVELKLSQTSQVPSREIHFEPAWTHLKTCGTRGPWRRDEKVGLPPLEKGGLPHLKRGAFGVKETCGNCTREEEEEKNKKRKGIYVVYGFSHVFSIKWIDSLLNVFNLSPWRLDTPKLATITTKIFIFLTDKRSLKNSEKDGKLLVDNFWQKKKTLDRGLKI